MTADLSPEQLQEIDKMLGSPSDLPTDFTTWWVNWLAGELQPVLLSLGGVSQIFFKAATPIVTSEGTTSTSFVDLATVGPTLSGLSNGRYLVVWGCNITSDAGTGYMSIEYPGQGGTDSQAAKGFIGQSGDHAPIMHGALVTLDDDDSNQIKAVYRQEGGGTRSFHRRWLAAVRIGNV